MQELIAQILRYLWGIWRYRWPGLMLAWTIAIGGWIWVWKLPEAYLATARLEVDSSSVLRPLLSGLAIQPDVTQRVNLMSRTLLSRPNLEKLMRMSDLDLNVQSDLEEERLLNDLKKAISLRGDSRNTSLYSVAYKNEDRDVAKRVVQSLITIFIESTLGEKRKDSSGAQAFLDQQIADYELRLSEAEARLADFKQRHVGMLPGETGNYYQRLESAKAQLNGARLAYREMENRRNELSRQLAGEEPVFFGGSSRSGERQSPIGQRIQGLEQRMDQLLVNYTPQHPEIIQIKALIETLENEREEEMLQGVEESGTSQQPGLQGSPVYQSMRTMLAEAEARVAELKVRVGEYQKRVKALEEIISNIPEIEVELKQLDRDYQVVSQQHNSLLKRRESALLSEKVEKNADGIKFRVIDPPFVPLKPNEPNKLMLNATVLVLALGAGVGLSFLISLLRPVFTDRGSLTEVSGLPVLGCVSLILPPEQQRKELVQKLVFASVCVGLFVVFAGVSLGHQLLGT